MERNRQFIFQQPENKIQHHNPSNRDWVRIPAVSFPPSRVLHTATSSCSDQVMSDAYLILWIHFCHHSVFQKVKGKYLENIKLMCHFIIDGPLCPDNMLQKKGRLQWTPLSQKIPPGGLWCFHFWKNVLIRNGICILQKKIKPKPALLI